MICNDCGKDVLTLAQHLRDGCQQHAARMLTGKDLPNRVLSGEERKPKSIRQHQPSRGRAVQRAERIGVRCCTPGCENWKIEGKSYCRPCHNKKCAETRERKRSGKKANRPPLKTKCAKCGDSNRASGDTYCKPCRSEINATARRRAAANVDYGAATWRSEGGKD